MEKTSIDFSKLHKAQSVFEQFRYDIEDNSDQTDLKTETKE
ncbi:MAG TPA: hypothetical protein VLB80_05380 [Candidatus Babeliales bacterium]|nr:hypothetical protein [Candidatus Babeliales bacterium]